MSNDKIVEPANDAGDLDALEKDLATAVAADAASNKETDGGEAPAGDAPAAEKPQASIPDKYRGKSVEEIISMHQNLESAYGRMANDLGQQRKFTDQLLDLKRSDDLTQNSPDPAPSVEVTAAEILDNPTAALERYYESRRAREESEVAQRLDSMETEIARGRFVDKHPDFEVIGNDPEFVNWLQASPLRSRAASAALQGDWQVADELLTEFKAQQTRQPASEAESTTETDEVAAARAAALESSSNAEASTPGSGKVYRRSDLVRLKLEKPHVYESEDFQREILRAYNEGRVV